MDGVSPNSLAHKRTTARTMQKYDYVHVTLILTMKVSLSVKILSKIDTKVTSKFTGFGDITLIDHTYLALIRILFVFCIGLVLVSLVFNAIRELAAAYQRRLVEVGMNKTYFNFQNFKWKSL